MSINYSQDIIQFVSILVDKLRTKWIVNSISTTDISKPVVNFVPIPNYTIENEEELELGRYVFQSGVGYVWEVILRGKTIIAHADKFSIENPNEIDLSNVEIIRNLKPYFYHGTYIDVNKELDTKEEIFSTALYPAVIVWEVIRQNFDSDSLSVIGNIPRLTMSFLDTTDRYDMTGTDQYLNVVNPMERYADHFINICENHNYLAKLNNYTYIKHTNWGKYVQDKGHIKYILDENLAGLNLEIDLPIKKHCLNINAKL